MRCATAGSSHYTARDGLLSDNIGKVFDDGESLWLSTTRGHLPDRQGAAGGVQRRQANAPGAAELRRGGRAAQRAVRAGYPTGGRRHADRGRAAVVHHGPRAGGARSRVRASRRRCRRWRTWWQMTANGAPVGSGQRGAAGAGQRPRADPVYGHPPERAGARAVFLPAGRAGPRLGGGGRAARDQFQQPAPRALPFQRAGGIAGRAGQRAESYDFEMLPQFWETTWFRALCVAALLAAGWAVYQFRLQQIRSRFALVLEERARLAREIHDTLAQGFVGISSQLDAVAMCMPEGDDAGAILPGHGAADGAPQPDRGAALRDGSARVGAGGAGPGGGDRIGHAAVDGGLGRRGGGGGDGRGERSCRRRWSSTCCASRRRRSPTR